MKEQTTKTMTRREIFGAAAVMPALVSGAMAEDTPVLKAEAGVDRVTILPGKTYLRGWAGYGKQPAPTVLWSKASGPGEVKFEDPKAPITTASFTTPGDYVLKLTAGNGQTQTSST